MKLLLSLFILLLTSSTLAASNLTVTITGIDSSKGRIIVLLFDENKKDSFPEFADVRRLDTPAKKGHTSVVFKNIPNAVYALSILHDKNNNGEMDTNFIGIPSEPYGNSGEKTNFKPNFNDSKFDLEKDTNIKVVIH